ncbi:hypothetical protein NA57DRAFT_78512 [Rhizodiscina lignyota]|uniref:Carbohydrate esterase family 16 protein n=1 Tax=Rhizodiscina lignyota TaxID=1504668 RepID=A0A9P4IC06_9PEZI|nr:hypothetical protein NA57DRAFT_78512 [Rhizodiscina lignyota]
MFIEMIQSFIILSCLFATSVVGKSPSENGYISKFTTTKGSDANYLLLFGDSYSRIEFNIHGKQPSKDDPLGNPAFPGDTTSGGVNWVGDLASIYNKSLTLVYDFAVGGATIDQKLIPPPGISVSFNDQVIEAIPYLTKPRSVPWPGKKSVVAIWFGQNDVQQAVIVRHDPSSIFGEAMSHYFANCEALYQAGARNFLFMKVAPIYKTPLAVVNYTSEERDALSAGCDEFNNDLDTYAKSFGGKHPDVTYHIYDPNPAFTDIIDTPKQNGAPDSLCFNPDGTTCLWLNNYHPGVAIHKQVAKDIAAYNYFPSFFTAK